MPSSADSLSGSFALGAFSTLVLFGGPSPAAAQAPADTTRSDTVSRLYELEGVRVDVASRAGAGRGSETRSVEVVTREEIRRIPARDVADLLAWSTGVETRSRSGAQADLSIRGSSFEQVVVLVDGVRMNDPQTGHFNLDLAVPIEDIERIEIVRGPASSVYGPDALGGVVNVVTRSGPRSGVTTARLEGGGFGQAGAALTGGARALGADWTGGGEFRRSDGHRDGTDYRVAKATVRGGRPLGDGRLRTDLGVALRDFGANGFFAAFDSYEETRTVRASASWVPVEGRRGVQLEPRFSFRLHDDDFVLVRGSPEQFRNQHTNWQVGAELVARADPSEEVALAGGVELRQEELDSNNLGRRSEGRAALFAEAVAGTSGDLVGTAGLRLDQHEVYGSELSPSLSVAWWPVRSVQLRGSAGRSYRTPSWTDRFLDSPANMGTPGLEPEVAWSGELGAELRGERTRLAVTGFVREADDLIDFARPVGSDPETTPWRSRNVESASFEGLEVEAAAVAPLDLRLEGALELLSVEAEASTGFVSKRALRPLTERLRLEATRSVADGVTATVRWTRARRRQGEEPFHRVDARLAYRFADFDLYLEGTNVTDDSHPDITELEAPGAALIAGLTWNGSR